MVTGSTIIKQFHISFDISTTNVGIALWDENGELLELKHLQLKVDKSIPQEDRYLYKADLFKEYILKFKERVYIEYDAEIINVFVEAPLYNSINIFTAGKLLSFNGISCYILYKIFNQPPCLISIHDSRKIFCPELVKKTKRNGKIKETLSFPKGVDKKEYLWKKVAKMQPEVNWFYKKNGDVKETSFDMSDSFVVGYSSLKVLGIIK